MRLARLSIATNWWMLKAEIIATTLIAGLVSSASAADRPGGVVSGATADPGVITIEQMQALQRQHQANVHGRQMGPAQQGSAGSTRVQLLPIEGPCLGEPSGGRTASQTQAQLRRMKQLQSRHAAQNAAKAKAAKAASPNTANASGR